jgi:hypothetical protein
MKTKILLLSTLSIALLLLFFTDISSVFSQTYQLTPDSPGDLPEKMKDAISFLVMGVGLVIFASLVYGGFLWMTSEGEPLKIQKSKNQILSSFIGLLIVLASYVLLNSINPTLVVLKEVEIYEVDSTDLPGVYLSLSGSFHENNLEEMRKNVRKIVSPESGLGNLKGNIKAIRIVNPVDDNGQTLYRHIVVLHGEENFRGPCEVISGSNYNNTSILSDTFSITVFRAEKYDPSSYGRVVLYNKPDFEDKFGSETLHISSGDTLTPLGVNTKPWSIDIEGNYAVVLASGSNWNQMNDECAVFASSKPIPNLTNHYMNTCNPFLLSHFFSVYDSCATHYALYSLFRR